VKIRDVISGVLHSMFFGISYSKECPAVQMIM